MYWTVRSGSSIATTGCSCLSWKWSAEHLLPAQGVARVGDGDRLTLNAPQIRIPTATTAGTRTSRGHAEEGGRGSLGRVVERKRPQRPAQQPILGDVDQAGVTKWTPGVVHSAAAR